MDSHFIRSEAERPTLRHSWTPPAARISGNKYLLQLHPSRPCFLKTRSPLLFSPPTHPFSIPIMSSILSRSTLTSPGHGKKTPGTTHAPTLHSHRWPSSLLKTPTFFPPQSPTSLEPSTTLKAEIGLPTYFSTDTRNGSTSLRVSPERDFVTRSFADRRSVCADLSAYFEVRHSVFADPNLSLS